MKPGTTNTINTSGMTGPASAPALDRAVIFNIQRFSLHDGPGIRTVVFFKGCPLRCGWCANPESQQMRPQLMWDSAKCLHCRSCRHTCPKGAISFNSISLNNDAKNSDDNNNAGNTILVCDPSLCEGCGECVKACPAQALSIEGREADISDILEECLKDRDFYLESGGGVTLSGGEAMLWPRHCIALTDELHKESIPVAIETTGHIKTSLFTELAPHFDLLLFDVKHPDPEKHREGTGVSNELILSNLKWGIENGLDILPRIPVIPGYNSSAADAAGFARVLKEAGAKKAQLLPFHQFGERKYDLLGRSYDYADVPALHEEDIEEFRREMTDNGIEAFI